MKLSGLLFGGLIGAAATIYLSKKRPGAIAFASSAMSDLGTILVNKSVTKFIQSDWKDEAVTNAPKSSDDTAKKSAQSWEQIELLLNSDPALKQEVEKIKAESSSITH
ncbi:hypothetical protein I6N90_09245 [Paenibacillus sp. GSMTC-2017]|uniref:hypothetical protein n=1 Tax=Paenibacillus sp. GSMTC-2017 TaxID=2794350 RepID=UPI0018D99F81|nr:hypothetical protein [Paenibacillus sp. GSMTC-2017]MBH5317989.1 hypothetical protein [Paenibacillus sp. GSMTC-2017]